MNPHFAYVTSAALFQRGDPSLVSKKKLDVKPPTFCRDIFFEGAYQLLIVIFRQLPAALSRS
jgi:hypothetical protein